MPPIATRRFRRSVPLLLVIAATAAVGSLTLLPAGPPSPIGETGCCYSSELIANTVLFIPLGAGLCLVGLRALTAAGLGGLVSLIVELAQLGIPGRFFSIHDVATNSLGALLGAIIVEQWARRGQLWRVVGPALAGLVIVFGIAAGWFVRPARLAPRTWFGWIHQSRGPVAFQGKALRFEVQGMPIPDGAVPESAELTRLLGSRDTVLVSAVVISAGPVVGRAQLVGIVAGAPGAEYLSLWQEGRTLLAVVRLRLADASLRTPWFRLADAFSGVAGDTVEISATMTRRELALVAVRGRVASQGTFRFSAGLFWAAFLPFEIQIDPGSRGWLLVPFGLPFVVLGMGIRKRSALVIGAVVTLLVGPLLTEAAFPQSGDLVIATVCSGLGRLLGYRLGLFAGWSPNRFSGTREPAPRSSRA